MSEYKILIEGQTIPVPEEIGDLFRPAERVGQVEVHHEGGCMKQIPVNAMLDFLGLIKLGLNAASIDQPWLEVDFGTMVETAREHLPAIYQEVFDMHMKDLFGGE